MSDGLGTALIALCIDTRGFNEATHRGVQSWMLREKSEIAWTYCLELCRKGEFPAKDEVESKYGISLEASLGETVESLSRRIKKRSHLTELKPIFEEAMKHIADGDPAKATDIVLGASRLRAKYATGRITEKFGYKENFEERILMYRLMKESGGILGAATRWPSLNRA